MVVLVLVLGWLGEKVRERAALGFSLARQGPTDKVQPPLDDDDPDRSLSNLHQTVQE
jgi:hypothetical protein